MEYNVTLRGEDGMEFCGSVTADSRDEAYEIAEDNWPESRIIEVMSPEDLRERERDVYERANRDYDNGYDDYDY